MIENITIAIAIIGLILLVLLISLIINADKERKLAKHRSKDASVADLLNYAAVIEDGVVVGIHSPVRLHGVNADHVFGSFQFRLVFGSGLRSHSATNRVLTNKIRCHHVLKTVEGLSARGRVVGIVNRLDKTFSELLQLGSACFSRGRCRCNLRAWGRLSLHSVRPSEVVATRGRVLWGRFADRMPHVPTGT